eukprot:Hpha_TRINITY_DN16453_c1_g10::TRINITY_DN16453_c1_g10_i1::g.161243::m.161243/K06889/K06889; uncharacterized protein
MLGGKSLSTDGEEEVDCLLELDAEGASPKEVPLVSRLAVVFTLGAALVAAGGPPSLFAVGVCLAGVTVAYAVYVLGLFCNEVTLVYPMSRKAMRREEGDETEGESEEEEPYLPTGVERWWVCSEGAKSEGWLFRGRKGAGLAVIFHGNGERVPQVEDVARWYVSQGLHALLVEYRGYGSSAGNPSEKGIVEDAIEHVRLAQATLGVEASRVLLHGRSLGGGVACQVAREVHPGGMILESTFTSVADLGADWGVHPGLARMILRNRYESADVLRNLLPTVLIAHGTRDGIVPYHHSRDLAECAGVSTLFTKEGAGHRLPFDAPFKAEILSYLRKQQFFPPPPPLAAGRG